MASCITKRTTNSERKQARKFSGSAMARFLGGGTITPMAPQPGRSFGRTERRSLNRTGEILKPTAKRAVGITMENFCRKSNSRTEFCETKNEVSNSRKDRPESFGAQSWRVGVRRRVRTRERRAMQSDFQACARL